MMKIISHEEVLRTVFEHVVIPMDAIPEFPLDFHDDAILPSVNTRTKVDTVMVPLMPFVNYEDSNKRALDLLIAVAQEGKMEAENATHQIITDDGIIELNLTKNDVFVFVTRDNEYGLIVLDCSNIRLAN